MEQDASYYVKAMTGVACGDGKQVYGIIQETQTL
jgi:hypothetical protein